MVNYLQGIQTSHLDLASHNLAIAPYHKVWTPFRMMGALLEAHDSIPKLALANKICKRSKNLDNLDKREGHSTQAT